jgi:hypothetical protein
MKLIENLAHQALSKFGFRVTTMDLIVDAWNDNARAAYEAGFRDAREIAANYVSLRPYGTITIYSDPSKQDRIHWDLSALNMIAKDISKIGEEEA